MPPHYNAGIDYFTPRAGTKETMVCEACKENLDVQRDVLITRGKYGNTLPQELHSLVDTFFCQHSDTDWHRQLIALLKECSRTPSQKISDILQSEIEEIRKTRIPTKGWSIFW